MSGNAWDEIKSIREKKASLRDRLAQRKKERQDILKDATKPLQASQQAASPPVKSATSLKGSSVSKPSGSTTPDSGSHKQEQTTTKTKLSPADKQQIEKCILLELDGGELRLPTDSVVLSEKVVMECKVQHSVSDINQILEEFEIQCLVVTETTDDENVKVLSVNTDLISQLLKSRGVVRKRKALSEGASNASADDKKVKAVDTLNVESLLASQSAKERETTKLNEEIQEILNTASAKEQMISKKFKSQGGVMKEFCSYGTRADCKAVRGPGCDKVHFRRLIHQHTDVNLGDCSFLNTCFHMDTCKYIHYKVDQDDLDRVKKTNMSAAVRSLNKNDKSDFRMMAPQWIQCDMRTFDMTVLGKFAVIMADPPWDIHMELPYGTMSDDEMRTLNIPCLQDDGYIFLWVTGRAMELGRQCLELWGYRRCDELIWVKTNQLQKLIRTGRTGHWLNHAKEHCLIGVKGNLAHSNRGLDCDVIVAEVRATSHKPDEVYGVIERLSPGTRKIELFGRPHNVQPNWITLGNQLDGVQLHEDDVKRNFKRKYPTGKCM